MDIQSSKDRFRILLKRYLKQKKVKQQRIAAALELTASAVSQMIKGKIVFSLRQLNTICEILALEPTQTFELQALLIRIRTDSSVGQSPFSRLVFALRCKRGLDHRQLANLTGIPAAKLRAFESDDDVSFSPDDAARLAPVLGCEVRELMASANITMNNTFYYQPTPPELIEAAEPSAEYGAGSLRELRLDELAEYKAGESIFAYASRCNEALLCMPVDLPYPALAITAPSEELGYEHGSLITVLVGDDFKDDCTRTVLARSRKSGFTLLDDGGRTSTRFLSGEKLAGELMWTLPVYQVIIRMRQSDERVSAAVKAH